MTFSCAALSRSGRSVATVSTARQPWAIRQAYSGHAAHPGPSGPTAFHRAQRGDENAVHIEKNALAADLNRGRSDGRSDGSIVAGTVYRFSWAFLSAAGAFFWARRRWTLDGSVRVTVAGTGVVREPRFTSLCFSVSKPLPIPASASSFQSAPRREESDQSPKLRPTAPCRHWKWRSALGRGGQIPGRETERSILPVPGECASGVPRNLSNWPMACGLELFKLAFERVGGLVLVDERCAVCRFPGTGPPSKSGLEGGHLGSLASARKVTVGSCA